MKLFFVNPTLTKLADSESLILFGIREALLKGDGVEEAFNPDDADVVLIQEEKTTYKEFRYINKLLSDPFLANYLTKTFTICTDDSSTGLLRGVYTSMPSFRYDQRYHRIVPYFEFRNQRVFTDEKEVEPTFLAGWFGNTKSNKCRQQLIDVLGNDPRFFIKTSQRWYNHQEEEHQAYVDLIKSCKFSLCPQGWAPASLRIFESMALGRCPVIIADHYAPPLGPKWNEFALFYPARKNMAGLPQFLLEHEAAYKEMGAKAKENWDKYFAGDLLKKYYADSMLSLIQSTEPYTLEAETKRWRSFGTYWNNRWTIPQRAVNKYRQLFASK